VRKYFYKVLSVEQCADSIKPSSYRIEVAILFIEDGRTFHIYQRTGHFYLWDTINKSYPILKKGDIIEGNIIELTNQND
jgi:hypothetical protein